MTNLPLIGSLQVLEKGGSRWVAMRVGGDVVGVTVNDSAAGRVGRSRSGDGRELAGVDRLRFPVAVSVLISRDLWPKVSCLSLCLLTRSEATSGRHRRA